MNEFGRADYGYLGESNNLVYKKSGIVVDINIAVST